MICSISKDIAKEPVLSSTGYIFEKSLILKHLENSETCPVSGEQLTKDNLHTINNSHIGKPRPLNTTSIPSLLQTFQGEWDSLLLETFNLKKQLEVIKKQLAYELYRNDAAQRVIARLIKERDEARDNLTKYKQNNKQVEEDNMQDESVNKLPSDIDTHITSMAKDLQKNRKERTISKELNEEKNIINFKEQSKNPTHSSTKQGIVCVDVNHNDTLIATGGVDTNVILFDRKESKVAHTLKGHTKKVVDVRFHNKQDLVFSCSSDNTVKIWKKESKTYQNEHTFTDHSAEVTGISLHPSGSYLVSSSRDKTWAAFDLNTAKNLLRVDHDHEFSSIQFHPDGQIIATGSTDNLLKLWDIKTQENVVSFPYFSSEISSISFSENGFLLSTSCLDGRFSVLDLRKLKSPVFSQIETGKPLYSVSFDHSGQYLASVGDQISIYRVDKSNISHLVNFSNDKGFTDFKWGKDAKWFVSTSLDRNMRLYN
eukprot:TRINITY_DN3715_c0_g1_i1.p1 TRINITY_DN3715_c0_g1~~TRINITY_DN3715_c0_g1_i1.p1  ORF type:complete len:483 (+),score=115.55 TRINITY_DN3715_c0_g1_i1:54-1502(+)